MKRIMQVIMLLGLGVSMCMTSIVMADSTSQLTKTKTATNLDNIDLNDTVEDPAYAVAGEEMAKAAAFGVIGEAAPLVVMSTIDGDTIDLGKIYGTKPVYIKFWATWCTPCRQQMSGFERTYKTLGDKIEMVALNIGFNDDEASVRAFREKYELTMPIVMDDGRFAKLFHLSVTPQHVLIGKDVRFAYIGHADNDDLEHAIQGVLSDHDHIDNTIAVVPDIDHVVKPGTMVPDTTVSLLGGGTMALKAQPDRLLAVQFFSSWCEWYLESTRPDTSKACARVREEIEVISANNSVVDWVGVAGGPWATEQDLIDYKNNHNVSIPLSLDKSNDLFRMFDVRDIPAIAIINSEGTLIRMIGPDEVDLPATVQAIIDEK